jgi:hypothetical protein
MTQAFNLSQFANKLNSSGQADVTTALTGTIPTANLASGTANSTTYLRGDQTWATVSGGGFSGATTNAVSSSSIVLTSASSQYQVTQINNATNNVITLPDATTLLLKGFAPYVIQNLSPIGANLSIKNNAGTIVGYLSAGQIGLVALTDNSTSAGVWSVNITSANGFFNWDANSITTNAPSGSGNYTIVGLSSTSFVRMWTIDFPGSTGASVSIYFQGATISGSTITFGSISSGTTISSRTSNNGAQAQAIIKAIRLSNSAFVLQVGYWNFGGGSCCVDSTYQGGTNFRVCTVSGTAVTLGSASSMSTPSSNDSGATYNDGRSRSFQYNACPVRLSDSSYAIIYNDSATQNVYPPYAYSGSLSCQVITVSGTTQTIGGKVTLGTSTYTATNSVVALSSSAIFVAYGQQTGGGATGRNKMVVISVSGTTPTWNTVVNINSVDISAIFNNQYYGVDLAVAPSASQVIFNIGAGTAEGTVSGTTPTYDCTPSNANSKLYLATSSKAVTVLGTYFNIATGGFTISNIIGVIPSATVQTYGSPALYNPLGAQPTTAYVGPIGSSTYTILGNTL